MIATTEVDLDVDSLFDFGLQRLLDGYTALIEGRALSTLEQLAPDQDERQARSREGLG